MDLIKSYICRIFMIFNSILLYGLFFFWIWIIYFIWLMKVYIVSIRVIFSIMIIYCLSSNMGRLFLNCNLISNCFFICNNNNSIFIFNSSSSIII